MEDHEFCDSCPGCRPAILDIKTGKSLPKNSPIMIAVNKVWDTQTTLQQRKAFIEVTLHNSCRTSDLKLFHEVQTILLREIQTIS
jgi:hypothetical protein